MILVGGSFLGEAIRKMIPRAATFHKGEMVRGNPAV
jgi:hypothetical protein